MSQTVSGIKENANKKKSGFGIKNGRMTRVKEVWSKGWRRRRRRRCK